MIINMETDKILLADIIDGWEYESGKPAAYNRQQLMNIMYSYKQDKVFLSKLLHSGFITVTSNGYFIPTDKFLLFRSSKLQAKQTATPPNPSNWVEFRNLINYYIDCIKQSDRPQFYLNINKEGKDYCVPNMPVRWIQDADESPIEHTIQFDAKTSPIMARIMNDNSSEPIMLGYPIEARYENKQLSRIIPIAMVPVGLCNSSINLLRSLSLKVKFNFKNAMINQEWIDNNIPIDLQQDLNEAIYQNGDLNLKFVINCLPGFVSDVDNIDPETLDQFIPETHNKRAKICNTAILFKASNTNYVKSLIKELEYISNAPCELLEETSLAYIYRNPPLKIDESNRRTAIPFIDNNRDQLTAVSNAISFPASRLQGPPGTGKTQVAMNIIANCINNGESVLFSSKNHKAVDAIKDKNGDLLKGTIPLVNFCIEDGNRTSWVDYDFNNTCRTLENSDYVYAGDNSFQLEQLTDEIFQIDNLMIKKEILKKNISDASYEFLKSQNRLFDILRGTEFSECLSAEDEKRVKQIQKICDVMRGNTLWNRLKQINKKATIGKMSDFCNKNAKFKSKLDNHQFEDIKDNLSLILKLNSECKAKQENYVDKSKELNSLNLTSSEFAKLDDTYEKINGIKENAMGYNWNKSATLAFDEGHEEIKDIAKKFKQNRDLVFAADASSYQLKEYSEAISLLHSIQPAWATSLLSLHLASPLLPGIFDQVIIDEASQCDTISLIPAMYRAKRVAIIGDPEQFKPVLSLTPKREKSIFNKYKKITYIDDFRYLENTGYSSLPKDAPFMMLREHFRCQPEIANFFSKYFYNDGLIIQTDTSKKNVPSCYESGNSIQWIDISSGLEEQIRAVITELKKIKASNYEGSIGVICPLNHETNKLQAAIRNIPGSDNITVSTAYGFQGGQMDTIIFLIPKLKEIRKGQRWYITSQENNNIYNVTISRAKSCLVIIGDKNECLNDSNNGILRAIASYPLADDVADYRFDSKLEEKLFYALKDKGIKVLTQYPVGSYRLDLAFIDNNKKIDIEVDGMAYHTDAYGNRKYRDIRRDEYVKERGWNVIRFTGTKVANDIESCVATIEDMIQATF